ncbi:hypothetical protein [Catenuloplanes niger]
MPLNAEKSIRMSARSAASTLTVPAFTGAASRPPSVPMSLIAVSGTAVPSSSVSCRW